MKKLTYGSFFIALGVVLPIAFHFFGGVGMVFLPMHIPVLLAGFFLGHRQGAMVGFLTPILSSFLTGMPPIPILYIMIFELSAYGFVAGLFYQRKNMNVILSLLLTMVTGRLIMGLAVFALQPLLGLQLNPSIYFVNAITTGLPGIAIQLMVIPVLVKMMERVTLNAYHAN